MKQCLALITVVFFFSCEKVVLNEPIYIPVSVCSNISGHIDTIQKYHQGSWKWMEDKKYSSYGWVYETPLTKGYEITLRLSGDTAIYFKNGVQDQMYRYRIQIEKEISHLTEDTMPVLATYHFTTNEFHHYYRVRLCRDNLQLLQTYRSDVEPDITYSRLADR